MNSLSRPFFLIHAEKFQPILASKYTQSEAILR